MTDRQIDKIRQEPPETVTIADDTAICSESKCRGGGGGGDPGGERAGGQRQQAMCVDDMESRGHRT